MKESEEGNKGRRDKKRRKRRYLPERERISLLKKEIP
jgi:hypothetical protein